MSMEDLQEAAARLRHTRNEQGPQARATLVALIDTVMWLVNEIIEVDERLQHLTERGPPDLRDKQVTQ